MKFGYELGCAQCGRLWAMATLATPKVWPIIEFREKSHRSCAGTCGSFRVFDEPATIFLVRSVAEIGTVVIRPQIMRYVVWPDCKSRLFGHEFGEMLRGRIGKGGKLATKLVKHCVAGLEKAASWPQNRRNILWPNWLEQRNSHDGRSSLCGQTNETRKRPRWQEVKPQFSLNSGELLSQSKRIIQNF